MSEDSSKPAHHKKGAVVPWGPVAAVLVTVVTYFASQFLVGFLFGFAFGVLGWSDNRVNAWIDTTYAQFLIVTASAVASLLVLKLFLDTRKGKFSSLGLMRGPNQRDVLYTLVGFVVYFGLLVVAAVIAANAGVDTEREQNVGFEQAKTTGDSLLLVFFSLVILPPIVEEILFRGFLFTGLRSKLNLFKTTIITSLLFAAPHLLGSDTGLLWIAAIDTFVLSLVLCYVREKTGALWASMGIHALKNGLAFVFLFVAVQ